MLPSYGNSLQSTHHWVWQMWCMVICLTKTNHSPHNCHIIERLFTDIYGRGEGRDKWGGYWGEDSRYVWEGDTDRCKLLMIERVQGWVYTYNIQNEFWFCPKLLPSSVLSGNHNCDCTGIALFLVFCLPVLSNCIFYQHCLPASSTRVIYWYRLLVASTFSIYFQHLIVASTHIIHS